MRVIVVGGGIGGLGAAIAVGRAGHQVVVLERAARLDPAGAGITLFANAMRALDRLGVGDAVRTSGAPAEQSAILTSSGRQLLGLPGRPARGRGGDPPQRPPDGFPRRCPERSPWRLSHVGRARRGRRDREAQ
ncbi:MAG: FAD-dependent monooxygenase [Solirubrobacterales bacterium]|nr:FAD-dependent monooxygenase [Solirubrobacterales bacterium]MBV9362741.1 FAD-dependent monooxygenase [Solirubrobacterales bacterium]